MKIEFNSNGKTGIKITETLYSPKDKKYSVENIKEKLRKRTYKEDGPGVYWTFSGNLYFNERFDGHFDKTKLSVVRFNENKKTRLEFFYEYKGDSEKNSVGINIARIF